LATSYEEFLQELENEASDEGPEAVAELNAFRVRYQLARELMEARRQHAYTQQRLAEISGVDQGEISKIETGRANPTVATVTALAAALDSEIHVVPRHNRLAV
jgi:XRE family transcriptional regulator, regulator of sulfur utilization